MVMHRVKQNKEEDCNPNPEVANQKKGPQSSSYKSNSNYKRFSCPEHFQTCPKYHPENKANDHCVKNSNRGYCMKELEAWKREISIADAQLRQDPEEPKDMNLKI